MSYLEDLKISQDIDRSATKQMNRSFIDKGEFQLFKVEENSFTEKLLDNAESFKRWWKGLRR